MKTFWKDLEEYKNPEEFRKKAEMAEKKATRLNAMSDPGSSRRDFLKTFGFSLAAATIAASCKKPVDKAIPFLIKPEEVTPGTANYYASTYFDANEYCSILVKTRDGRPIKIEGNNLSPISMQGTSARVQASVLNLYDDSRLKGPVIEGRSVNWDEIERTVIEKLNQLKAENKKVVLLSSTLISPSAKKLVAEFLTAFPNIVHVVYDAVSATGILTANKKSFGQPFIPDYRFDKAKIIVSFGADFLGTWLSPVEFTKRYSQSRNLKKEKPEMGRHYQFESGMSVTGANADVRIPVRMSDEKLILTALYDELLKKAGLPSVGSSPSPVDLSAIVADLHANKGNSLVISGSNNSNIQLIVNAINNHLESYGSTVDTTVHLLTRQGIDPDAESIFGEIKQGAVAGLLCWNVNPVYDHPDGTAIGDAIKKLGFSVSFSDRPDETSMNCKINCPEPHYLESWNDAEPKTGSYSLVQPAIRKLFDSRQVEESILKWIGKEETYYSYLIKYWEENLFPVQSTFTDFKWFWNDTLQKGVFEKSNTGNAIPLYTDAGLADAVKIEKKPGNGLEVIFYEAISQLNGKFANNPWLQELPDPISKISWDNFAAVPVKWAEENDVSNEQVISINGVTLPVYIQPGQAANTISVALGYGREVSGKTGNGIGKNMFRLTSVEEGARRFLVENADVKIKDEKWPLALSQGHHSMEGRPIIRETSFKEWELNPASGNELHEETLRHEVTLYPKYESMVHNWGLAVDLSACIGCGNCAISCQAENNVPVVGKEQVKNWRIMHWIRIDRYFSDDPENPEVYFQPLMCQHCDNAPCENVCPVSATPHSEEGLNQVAYNRCVGTKYCMNNCPYRVRRFNWFKYVKNDMFDYHANSDLGRMVLNPDVVVRSRGVIEKCSMCVQRIQEKKTVARVEGRPLMDGEIQPACAQSCPANAIVFGDLNDPESKVSKILMDKRKYSLLEELHTLPSVGYLTKVKNKIS
jgi:Fe-S-cluster-containing dehydrogenase component/anaerobic selenocysteine-containing dehydrogenase